MATKKTADPEAGQAPKPTLKKPTPARKGTVILADLKNPLGSSRREDAEQYMVLETTPDQVLIQVKGENRWVSNWRTFDVQGSL